MDTIIKQTESGQSTELKTGRVEKVSLIILLITTILVPLMFLPTVFAPVELVKTIVISVGVLLSSILCFISLLRNKNTTLVRHPLISISFGIILSTVISLFVSTSPLKSFFGKGFETDTVSFIFVLFLTMFVTAILSYNDKKRFSYILGATIISFSLVSLFHILRLVFGQSLLTFGVFTTSISTMLGKWNDLAIFSGVMLITSYLFLRFGKPVKLYKIVHIILMVVSGIFIFLINSSFVWCALTIVFAAILCLEFYNSSVQSNGINGFVRKINTVATIILLISAIGLWKGDVITNKIITKLNIVNTEVVLPWQFTLDIATDTIKESPLFGAGPNRFVNQYLKYKPLSINQSVFWGTEFNSGFGYIPDFIITQGIVGIILWILFIMVFIYTGYKALKSRPDNNSLLLISSTFFTSVFLWILSVLYVPSHSMLFLTFVFSGLFLSLVIKKTVVNRDTRFTKVIPLIALIIIIACIIWLAIIVKKSIAIGYFQSGVSALNLPDNKGVSKAENNFRKAIAMDRFDTYFQALSEVNILKITALGQQIHVQSQQAGSKPDEGSVKEIGSLIEESIKLAREAISIDPTNYYNYISEGRISELALSLQIQNSYDNTKNAYMNALKYNPYNPLIYLTLARIEASQSKIAEAQKDIGLALQLKSNYLDAIFLLSQIQVNQGQLKDAITSVQVASQINPTNPLIFFQLGLLYYNDKDYQGAIDALNKAVKLDDKYANARYFLGLSYARLNKFEDAIVQFENLRITNPDNQEVKLILDNLRSGRSPFTDAKPPIDNKPEKRKTLPIKEKAQVVKPTTTQ